MLLHGGSSLGIESPPTKEDRQDEYRDIEMGIRARVIERIRGGRAERRDALIEAGCVLL